MDNRIVRIALATSIGLAVGCAGDPTEATQEVDRAAVNPVLLHVDVNADGRHVPEAVAGFSHA